MRPAIENFFDDLLRRAHSSMNARLDEMEFQVAGRGLKQWARRRKKRIGLYRDFWNLRRYTLGGEEVFLERLRDLDCIFRHIVGIPEDKWYDFPSFIAEMLSVKEGSIFIRRPYTDEHISVYNRRRTEAIECLVEKYSPLVIRQTPDGLIQLKPMTQYKGGDDEGIHSLLSRT